MKVAIAASFGLLALDRVLKRFALHSLPDEGVFWIPRLLGLERYDNHGLAFGIPAGSLFPILLSILALAFVTYTLFKRRSNRYTTIAASLIILGALSNLYDRVAYGFVVDYLRVGPLSLVNIADGMVVAGLVLLLVTERKPHGTPA